MTFQQQTFGNSYHFLNTFSILLRFCFDFVSQSCKYHSDEYRRSMTYCCTLNSLQIFFRNRYITANASSTYRKPRDDNDVCDFAKFLTISCTCSLQSRCANIDIYLELVTVTTNRIVICNSECKLANIARLIATFAWSKQKRSIVISRTCYIASTQRQRHVVRVCAALLSRMHPFYRYFISRQNIFPR